MRQYIINGALERLKFMERNIKIQLSKEWEIGVSQNTAFIWDITISRGNICLIRNEEKDYTQIVGTNEGQKIIIKRRTGNRRSNYFFKFFISTVNYN